jgi:hypothetical protein
MLHASYRVWSDSTSEREFWAKGFVSGWTLETGNWRLGRSELGHAANAEEEAERCGCGVLGVVHPVWRRLGGVALLYRKVSGVAEAVVEAAEDRWRVVGER